MVFNETGKSRKAFVSVDPRSKFLLLIVANVMMFNRPELALEIAFVSLLTALLLNGKAYMTAVKFVVIYAAMLFIGSIHRADFYQGRWAF